MTAWYYAKDGQQNGPVSTDEIVRLFGTGTIGPKDLVWREGMAEWKPAGEVPELAPKPPAPPVATGAASAPAAVDPYRPPSVSWNELAAPSEAPGDEIVPGSQPLEIGPCISRAWELMKLHFGTLIAVAVICTAIGLGFGFLTRLPVALMEGGANRARGAHPSDTLKAYQILVAVVRQILDLFLGLGAARIGLNIVSGKPVDIAMLFGEGRKLGSAILATIIYVAMVFVGLVLLVVPGIYLALRFGQYKNAIVDKDLGAIDALKYSAKITQGNVLNLFGFGIVCFLIIIAGLLALVVGLIVAIPVTFLASFLAYRWLQYGRASVSR